MTLALMLSSAANAQTVTSADPAQPSEPSPAIVAQAGETAPAEDPATATGAEVVVTGSRLGSRGFNAPTPVTVIGEAKLETRAPTNIADVLNEIPAFRQTSGPGQSQRSSAGSGQNNLDLRGLGIERTLLLIDGKRQSTTDTNTIPVGMIERVEVVTGGASAAYGSDAVAGVANFILKHKLNGVEGTLQNGISQQGDNAEQFVSLTAGTSFASGRGSVVAGIDYANNKGVGTIYGRDWGRRQVELVSFGSTRPAGTPAQAYLDDVTFSGMTPGGVIVAGPATVLNTAFGPGGTPYPFQRGTVYSSLMTGGSNPFMNPSGNFAIRVPIERVTGMARAEYEFSPAFKLTAEGAYSRVDGGGVSNFFQAPSIIVSINNPFLPTTVRNAAIAGGANPTTGTLTLGRTFTELGGYRYDTNRQTMRGSIGASGELGGSWKWDAYYQVSRSRDKTSNFTNVLGANFLEAAYAVRDASGAIVCGAATSNPNLNAARRDQVAAARALTNAACVPINIFGVGSPSAAAIDYVTGNSIKNLAVLTDRLHVAAASISGSPFSTWAGPVQFATGFEYRNEKLSSLADPLSQGQLWAATNGATYAGSLNVKEGFVELGVPLAKDSEIGTLDLNGAVRYTDYSTSGSVTTWKVGGVYEPFDAVRFRVTRSRDIRAPNLTDLFQSGATQNVANFVNPRNGQTGNLRTQVVGNPNLVAERADTWTAGIVLQPKWAAVRGLRASFDYYNIEVNGVITSPQPLEIVQRCIAGDQSFCNAVTFDTTTFGLESVRRQPFNLNRLKTSGIDFELSYSTALDGVGIPGRLAVRALANHTFELKTTDSSGTIDRAGFAQGNGVPEWTGNIDLTYSQGGFIGTFGTRFFSAINFDALLVGPDSPNYNPAASNSIADNTLPSRTYFDLSLQQEVLTSGRKSFQVFALVSNLLDKDPPGKAIFIRSGGNPYDLIGRTFKAGVRFKF